MPPAAFPTSSKLDRITVQSESAGRRFAPDGGYLTSSAGAMGEWQVMPETARYPGFGIRPWDGRSADDLARVGKEYRDAMQQRYRGDLSKMWAAYNAGPGRVDALVDRHGEDWLRHAPSETQTYVAGNLRALRSR